MVTNTGAGIANNLTITSAQPTIIDNQKGLLVNFQIIGTEIGSQTVSPSLTVNLGNIAPGATQVAQFIMTSSLEGKFVDYQASFQHTDALGGAATSVIDSVEIHELIHVVQADRAGDDALPDFLVNDIPDANSQPDTLYMSDGSIAPVNLATNGQATLNGSEAVLTANMPSGWSYLEIPDPGAGLKLAKAVRSDGKVMLVGPNVWQTDRTFPNSTTYAVHQQLVHLFDYNGTGSYTLYYTGATTSGSLQAPVQITQLGPVIPAVQSSPVDTVEVTFSREIDPSTLSGSDVALSLNGGPNLLAGNNVSITQISGKSYEIGGLAGFNAAEGTYVLTVNANSIKDLNENPGQGSATVIWAISTGHVAVVSAGGFDGVTVSGSIPAIDIVFSEPINPASFNIADVSLSRNGGGNLLSSSNSITQTSGTTFRIGGLGAITKANGTYAITVHADTVTDTNGVAGVGQLTDTFTVDSTGPTVAFVNPVSPNPRNTPISSLDLVFSKPIVPSSFGLNAVKLTLKGKPVSLATASIIAIDGTTYRISNLDAATGFAGNYQLTVNATGVRDSLGNPGTGAVSQSWSVILGTPAAPTNLEITPDNGVSAHDHITNTLSISVTGKAGATATKVRITDAGTGTMIAQGSVSAKGFRIPAPLSAPGGHTLLVQAIDSAGNISKSSTLNLFIDLSTPTVTVTPVTPTPRDTPVSSVDLSFSEAINHATFSTSAISLTRDGVNVPLAGKARLISLTKSSYTLENLSSFTKKAGIYTLTVSAAKSENIAGTKGQGTASTTWRLASDTTSQDFTSFAGTYTGLALNDPPTHQTSGIISIALTPTGSLTASGKFGGAPYSLRGSLDNNSKFTGQAGKGATAPIISMTLDTDLGANAITGTIVSGTNESSFIAERLIYSNSAPTPLAGQYTLLFLTGTAGASDRQPHGDGYGILTVAPNGTLSTSGKLADGTSFSESTTLEGEDEWPFYISMDGGKSSAVGLITFQNDEDVSDLDGGVRWYRASRPARVPFAVGFTGTLSMIGSAYMPPAANEPVFDFGSSGEKAQLVLSEGGINPDLVLPFTFDSHGKAVFSDSATSRPSMTVTLKNGLVGGSVRVPGDKATTAFAGVLFPKQKAGSGYFIRLSTGGLVELMGAP